jgi:hypothetical protein
MTGISVLRHGGTLSDASEADLGPFGGIALFVFFLELFTTLGNSKRRALHDLIAGTVVIRLGAQPQGASDDEIEFVGDDPQASRALTLEEFACTTCARPVSLGASHCHACGQTFTYQDGRPIPQ